MKKYIVASLLLFASLSVSAQSLMERFMEAQNNDNQTAIEATADNNGSYSLHFLVTGQKPATIYVDGEKVGETKQGQFVYKVGSGSHSYKIKLSGHKTGTGKINVPNGDATVSLADKMTGKKVKYGLLLLVPPVWSFIWIGPKLFHLNSEITYEQTQVWVE